MPLIMFKFIGKECQNIEEYCVF